MAAQSGDDRELLESIGLNFAEAAFLCEALRALWLSPQFTERMWAEMRDVSRIEGLDQKWATSGNVVFDRLGKMNRAEAVAVVRAAIQFWGRRKEPTAKLLRELGLLSSRAPKVRPASTSSGAEN
jgi:hypothetical protein